MMSRIFYVSIGVLLLIGQNSSKAQVFNKVVAKYGSGNYTTIQAALNSVSNNSSTRTLIFVKKGVYYEKVDLAATKINVSLIGEDADSVIITYDDNYNDGTPAAQTHTFYAEANDFYAENITFENSSGAAGQALAIHTIGERQVFKNCKFLGFQDTYYAHKNRQYNLNCYISGATDFIYGDATCVFENCTIMCKSGGSYISAPADAKTITQPNYPSTDPTIYHGLLFKGCDVLAASGVSNSSYYLGRPWNKDASSVYINCRLGDHIKPEGWSTWESNNHLSGCFAEYRSRDTAGVILDVSSRVSWSKQLTISEVNDYYNLAYFLKKNDVEWDPLPITESLAAPSGLQISSQKVSWTGIDTAKGYIIFKNGEIFGFTASDTITDTNMVSGDTYSVKSVSVNGNLSEMSGLVTGIPFRQTIKPDIKIYVAGNELYISEEADIRIYSVSGVLMDKFENVKQVHVGSYQSGVYIARLTTQHGMVRAAKFYIH
ncbi:MAG: hypothetical protein JXB49_21445 [Bacteroidales bacterium]|nr:hypothetical protein [Bacteroidales bacterium]